MKFENGIAKKYRHSIEQAFDTILDKGNKMHRFLMQEIVDSEMVVSVFPVSKVNASGITGVTNPIETNKRLRSGKLELTDAFREVFITIAEETIDTGGQRGCEGTFVHEGRHAYDFARVIQNLSNPEATEVINPTLYELEWEAHLSAAEYMLEIGKEEYLQEGLDLLVLGELNGKYYVNEKGIKQRLKNSYGLELGGNLGPKAMEMFGLKKARRGIIKSLFG